MGDDALLGEDEKIKTDEIAFDYIKNSDFRTIWVDGAIGGVNPNGTIHFAIYNERPALPRRQVYKVDDKTGQLGVPVPEKAITRGSIVREMSCDLMISPENAESLANWLLRTVEEAKKGNEE